MHPSGRKRRGLGQVLSWPRREGVDLRSRHGDLSVGESENRETDSGSCWEVVIALYVRRVGMHPRLVELR